MSVSLKEAPRPLSPSDIYNRVDEENKRYFLSTTLTVLGALAAPFLALQVAKDTFPMTPEVERGMLEMMHALSFLFIASFTSLRVNDLRRIQSELSKEAKQVTVRVSTKFGGLFGLDAELDYKLLYE